VHVHEVEFAGMKTLVKGQLLTYNTAPARDGR
jgi:cold shock CspA family protein